ncbi:hypothetical protein MM239_14380 [Belliella sp. DSM 111904]|uniref:Uncharacterized protein n=1 Tax=Belliella filtrata TaxID=2923435 RepID=A0ABS9V2F0_9BACT|nr:hypothetical protein [Belliella filtrata]MCH7410591.1 hypothetical protein [Belliella filtrata]
MDVQTFIVITISGVVATIAMTTCMYIYAKVTNKNTKVVHVLSKMVSGSKGNFAWSNIIMLFGACLHVGIGILFAFIYYLLWHWDVLLLNLEDSFWAGALSGLLAISFWSFYFIIHRIPQAISRSHYMFALLLSHIIFAMVCINFYKVLI